MKIRSSKIEYVRHSLNFANYCQFSCIYCYMDLLWNRNQRARAAGLMIDKNYDELRKQLAEFEPKGQILMSTSHDPFMSSAGQTALNILKILKEFRLTKYMRILTKAYVPVDMMSRIPPDVLFGVSITTLNEDIQKIMEPGAAAVSDRIEMLKIAHKMGLRVWVSAEPYLQGMDIQQLIDRLGFTPQEIWVGPLNYTHQNRVSVGEILMDIEKLDLQFRLRHIYFKEELRSLVRRLKLKSPEVANFG